MAYEIVSLLMNLTDLEGRFNYSTFANYIFLEIMAYIRVSFC